MTTPVGPPPSQDASRYEYPIDAELETVGITQGDVQAFVSAASDTDIQKEAKARGLTPTTRRLIVVALAIVALTAIGVTLWLALADKPNSEALLTLAATSVGAIGGMAVPSPGD